MESVGQTLREARLRDGLTVQDVNARTRISVNNLLSIEADELHGISSRFLYKSFVRQVGQALKVESAVLEERLSAAAAAIPEPLVPGQPGAPVPPRLQSLRPQRIRVSRWVYSVSLLIVMLVACSTLYAMWQNKRSRGTASEVAFLNTRHVDAVRLPAHSSLPAAVATAVVPDAADRPFLIQLSALEQTWLSVVADGKEVYSGMLRTAETKTLEGYDTARIRTGNAGGVEVVFNGRKLGALGSRGQVRTVVFNRNGYEILEPQARLSLTSFDGRSGG